MTLMPLPRTLPGSNAGGGPSRDLSLGQTDLKITRLVGTSKNAVRIQIAVALIAFLLLCLAQAAEKAVRSPVVFARLVRANLMHRRSIQYLLSLNISHR
ncbi:hypothetical protein AYJ54_13905 [Bradyrhizobium centrolobii]|uniref:Uncharacterized protein n=1 Tax=Bradyrhizobium centrolobii TaxID=1505087 RepID=A0A176YQZ5_9BRAD|nr:hypothetical protein AYJ54_13905 [Bradyrhizobium centrolobii]